MTMNDVSNKVLEIEIKLDKINALLVAVNDNYFRYPKTDISSENKNKVTNALHLYNDYAIYSELIFLAHDIVHDLRKEVADFQDEINI